MKMKMIQTFLKFAFLNAFLGDSLRKFKSVPAKKPSSETGLKVAEMFPNRIISLTAVTMSIIDFPYGKIYIEAH